MRDLEDGKMRTLVTAGLAAALLASAAGAAEEKTARIGVQNSSGAALYSSLDAARRTLTVRRARFKGAVEIASGRTALYTAPAAKYSAVLPGAVEKTSFTAGEKVPTVVVLTRVKAGDVDRIEAAVKGATEAEVEELTEAERRELREKLKERAYDEKVKKVPTAEELMPLISNWTYHEKWNFDARAEQERRRARAIDELERLMWARYWAAPYYPEYDEPWFGRRPRRRRPAAAVVGASPLSYEEPAVIAFHRRFRPAIVIGADDWRFHDGSVFLHHVVGGADFWVRWDY